jgi:hypothetical protein
LEQKASDKFRSFLYPESKAYQFQELILESEASGVRVIGVGQL